MRNGFFLFTLLQFAIKLTDEKYFLGSGQISHFRVGYRVRMRFIKSLGSFDQVIFKGRISPDDVVWLKINRTFLAEESGMGQNDPHHSVRTFCPRGKRMPRMKRGVLVICLLIHG